MSFTPITDDICQLYFGPQSALGCRADGLPPGADGGPGDVHSIADKISARAAALIGLVVSCIVVVLLG